MRAIVLLVLMAPAPGFALGQLLPAPDGSGAFGTDVVFLPNGNFVVTDPGWSPNPEAVGAVYLYAPDGALISRLTGSTQDDNVGAGGIVVLANGNFVVRSPFWDAPGAVTDAGAVTFGDADTGFGPDAQVSASNSLVGTMPNSVVGAPGVHALPNGNYVVASDHWWDGVSLARGAVTWGDGNVGTSGAVGPGNSLVGTSAGDHVGFCVTVLPNGNYVVASPAWDNGATPNVGAATLRPGDIAAPAAVGIANSIVGASAGDNVGSGGVFAVGNDAVIASPDWANGTAFKAGAVTWMSGLVSTSATVDSDNSFVGMSKSDLVGAGGVVALDNGNYAFASPFWDRGGVVDAGAITLGFAGELNAGTLTAANSVVGVTADDRIGSHGLTPLPGGDFVALSPLWDNVTLVDAGAATRVSGNGSTTGSLPGTTSLRGGSSGDLLGSQVVVLANGNYVVKAPFARIDGVVQAGAVAWCPGSGDCARILGSTTALVGTRTNDLVGSGGVLGLATGHYLVASPVLDTATAVDAGAITWADGDAGAIGAIGPANSMLGRATDDGLGCGDHLPLPNGDAVVFSCTWSSATTVLTGAATFVAGGHATLGTVEESNSSFTNGAGDLLGVSAHPRWTLDHRVIVSIPNASNGPVPKAGAVAVLDPAATGIVDLDAWFRGTTSNGGASMRFDWHEASQKLLAGDPAGSRVWLATLPPAAVDAAIFHDGFE